VGPEQTDILFCLTDSDQTNIISSLVGRTLGFKRVIPSIQNPDFEEICLELQLEDTILPSRTTSRFLADMADGVDSLQLSTIIKGEARFFTFIVESEQGQHVADLDLPQNAKVVCTYRNGEFSLADSETRLRQGDEVVILAHSESVNELKERWNSHPSGHARD